MSFTVKLPIGPKEREEWLHFMVGAIHNEYVKVEETHPADIVDWTKGIHDLQKVLALRECRENNPERWKTIKIKK